MAFKRSGVRIPYPPPLFCTKTYDDYAVTCPGVKVYRIFCNFLQSLAGLIKVRSMGGQKDGYGQSVVTR